MNEWMSLAVLESGLAGAIILGVMGVGGLILWVIGRSIAKPACVVSGLVLGAVAGLVAGTVLITNGLYVIPLMVFGGIIGALLAGLLFRVWMGISGAVILGMIAPVMLFVWQGSSMIMNQPEGERLEDSTMVVPLDEKKDLLGEMVAGNQPVTEGLGVDQEQIKALAERVISAVRGNDEAEASEIDSEKPKSLTLSFAAPSPDDGTGTLEGTDAEGMDAGAKLWQSEAAQGVIAHVNQARIRAWEQISAWWGERDQSTRFKILVASGIGGLIGLLFGLIVPYIAAAVESALVGALLMMFASVNLVTVYVPGYGGYVPSGPRSFLLFLGLITVVGVLIQWIIFRRRADK
ncbi:hypothetical protein [Poriferisphaera sp. WC338]|uniref:hypothetical protein n=1 Tax=Poriferisphaera sp. WC338 TaxID=3425129 RepID=UPI003D81289C